MFRPRTRWLALAAATLLVVALPPASAAYADTTTGIISGHLLDNGAPVANVSVDVLDANRFGGGSAITDADGFFLISGINPGDYAVEFLLPGGLVQFSHGRTSFDTADRFTVTAGSTTSIEESVLPHGSMGGTLLTSTGAPAPGWTVQVTSTNFATFLSGRTDTDGHYLLPFVPPGTYTVRFTDPVTGRTQFAHGRIPGQTPDQFTVTAGATTTVNDQLVATGTITGRVTTADGLAAAGVVVFAGSDGVSGTDLNGVYTITVVPGTYQIQFRLPSGLVEWAHRVRSQDDAASFTVAADATVVVDEQLLPTGTITGHLVDSAGQPIQFGTVRLVGPGASTTGFITNGDWQAEADPGSYTVAFDVFSGSAEGTQWAFGRSSAATADHITVQAGQTTRVDDTLAAPGTVVVTVVDSLTGAPVPYCGSVGSRSACSDTGTATFAGLLPGAVPVDVAPTDDHLSISSSATVVSGQTTAITLAVTPGASIRTTVRDATTGTPVPNVCLHTTFVSSPSPFSPGPDREGSGDIPACSDDTGTVVLTGLRANSYNIFAEAGDGVHGHQWVGAHGGTGQKEKAAVVTLATGQAVTIPDIRMDKAGTLTGVVRDQATGTPIENAVATILTSTFGGGAPVDVFTDAEGQYTISGLGPYDWPIFYSAFGYASEWSGNTGNRLEAKLVTIRAGKTRTHNETLGQGVTVTGLISGPAGPSSARVAVLSADSRDETGFADSAPDGTYLAHVLPHQSVVLRVLDFSGGNEIQYFYLKATTFASATPITIQRPGPVVINLSPPPQG